MPSFDTPEPIVANIEPGVGNVHVIATDRLDTVVDVQPTDPSDDSDVKAAQQTTVEYSAGTLTVKGPKVNMFDWSNKTRSIEVTVELPAGSRLFGTTGVGDFRAQGRLGAVRYKSGTGHFSLEHTGELTLNTATGNIVIDRVEGKADINTSSGRVQISEITGTGVVKNSNGATTIGAVAGSLRVRSANGDITVEHPADAVDAKTANGAVRVLEAVRGSHTLETSMGNIEIGIREGTAAWLDVNTRFGRVVNEMTEQSTPDGSTTDTAEVRAQTSFGDITIHRS
jgi:Putative adhesin